MPTAARVFEYRTPRQDRAISSVAEARAWTAFWQEQDAGSRCLRSASNDLHDVLAGHWNAFARILPVNAKVIDVGCGTGLVGRLLIEANAWIQVVGIDTAELPPVQQHPRLKILPEIAIETVPALDRSCDAVVSQFGYEYADIHSAAPQLARILKPGGRLSFVVHHFESPIVQGDQHHHNALRAMMGDGVREPFLAGDRSRLAEELSRLQERFPDETTLVHLRPGLLAHIASGEENRRRVWHALKEALSPDCVLSDALEASCVAPADIDAWLEALRPAFEVDRPSILQLHGQPLAWKIEGRRKMR
jgi:SAM-dependent methyltransferase